ncbi:MAG: hydroxyisourate hydrolase [Sporichthyaceae bacterium]|nr:hydroxyisourate hydrolase [Sporichthyaceae bacterium]
MTLSTHVLDTGLGEPAAGVPVTLERRDEQRWVPVAAGVTDADGRLRDWFPEAAWRAGSYRLIFDTAARSPFFPEVSVVFVVTEPARHHHVPLLLTRYGYSTYRGS